jgi:hypothetical protein
MNEDDAARVTTPAALLLVTGGLSLVANVLGIVTSLAGIAIRLAEAAQAALENQPTADALIAMSVAAFAAAFTLIPLVTQALGLAASAITIHGGRKLMIGRDRGQIYLGAALAVAQPLLFVFTGCFTSVCGMCAPCAYLPIAILGGVAAVMTFTTLAAIPVFDDELAA